MSHPTSVGLSVTVDAGSGSSVRGVTLTMDASEVQGTVRMRAKRSCTKGAGYVFTCHLTSSHQRSELYDLVVLGADKRARAGAHGTVRFSATGPNGQRAEAEMVMTAGTPEFWGRKLSFTDAPVGKPVKIWGGVLNHGPMAASGFVVRMGGGPRLKLDHRYSNCRYEEVGESSARCVFDTPVEPGEAYAFDAPFVVEGGKDLTKGTVEMRILAPGQDEDPASLTNRRFEVPGKGPKLGLTPTGPTGFSPKYHTIPIDTDRHVDIRAVAGGLRGQPGDVIPLEVGLRNQGQGRVDSRYLRYEIVPPKGVTLIPPDVPSVDPDGDELPSWNCSPRKPGEDRYVCGTKNLGPGASDTQVLRFRIDGRTTGTGYVRAVLKGGYAERDSDKGNNAAAIKVQVPGARADEGPGSDGRSGGPGWGLTVGAGLAGALALAASAWYAVRRYRS
ncbi:hypothetical protein LK08_07960 [Streptomyces sp. MUSC 125]|nr:hypothetical protein LK08_07960 [Streptomyces sp. MUSC 125]